MSLRLPEHLGFGCPYADANRTSGTLLTRPHLRPCAQSPGLGDDCWFFERNATADHDRERWRRYDLLAFVPLSQVVGIPIAGEG